MQLRRSPREIEARDSMAIEYLRNQRKQILSHHLSARWPCIDMAVSTALVAPVAEIDLQCCEKFSLKGRENGLNNSHRLHADKADSSRQNASRLEKRMLPLLRS